MIDLAKLTEQDVGRWVIYNREFCKRERGLLSSWNHKFIFVRFKGPNGEACEPADVSFEFPMVDNMNGTNSTTIDT